MMHQRHTRQYSVPRTDDALSFPFNQNTPSAGTVRRFGHTYYTTKARSTAKDRAFTSNLLVEQHHPEADHPFGNHPQPQDGATKKKICKQQRQHPGIPL